MKQLKKILAGGVILTSTLLFGFAFAQQPYPETTIKYEVVDVVEGTVEVTPVTVTPKPAGILKPFKESYVFGSVGTTTKGKGSTVMTVGVGRDLFKFYNDRITLGIEGAFTHFTGKKLDSVNNDGTKGVSVVDKKNLIELGGKLSYQFDEYDSLNFRVFGKAGIASTTLKNTNHISPYLGIGAEMGITDSNVVFVAEAKQYTNLRKAQVYYAEDRGVGFNTRKDNAVVSLGIQYRF